MNLASALKPYKKELDYSYTFGVFPTLEMLANRSQSALGVLVHTKGEKNVGIRKIEEACRKRSIEFEVNDKVVERLSPKENSYVIGVFSKYELSLNKESSHVALVNPSDMGNLGAIIRTMAGFAVKDLALVRPCVDIFDPRVVRASMGALFHVSFQYFDTFHDYRQRFEHNLYPFMTNGVKALGETLFQKPFTLVFGNEAAGLPSEYRSMGISVSIRHTCAIDSLNLPIAVSIALYEAMRDAFKA